MEDSARSFGLNLRPRWPLLERANLRLCAFTAKAFRDALAEDAPSDGPRLPLFTKLILDKVTLTAPGAYYLWDMLIKGVEQGVPFRVLNLRQCFASDRAVQLLKDVVVEVKQPAQLASMKRYGGIEYFDEDLQAPWSAVSDRDKSRNNNVVVYDDEDEDRSNVGNDDEGNNDDGDGDDDDGNGDGKTICSARHDHDGHNVHYGHNVATRHHLFTFHRRRAENPTFQQLPKLTKVQL